MLLLHVLHQLPVAHRPKISSLGRRTNSPLSSQDQPKSTKTANMVTKSAEFNKAVEQSRKLKTTPSNDEMLEVRLETNTLLRYQMKSLIGLYPIALRPLQARQSGSCL